MEPITSWHCTTHRASKHLSLIKRVQRASSSGNAFTEKHYRHGRYWRFATDAYLGAVYKELSIVSLKIKLQFTFFKHLICFLVLTLRLTELSSESPYPLVFEPILITVQVVDFKQLAHTEQ